MTSSSLCKKLQGVVLPFFVEAVENRIDDAVKALNVGKHHHRPGSTPRLHEAALDGIRGAQLLPEVLGEGKEVEQFGQILLQALDQAGIDGLPGALETAKGLAGLGQAPRLIDFLGVQLHLVVIAPADSLKSGPLYFRGTDCCSTSLNRFLSVSCLSEACCKSERRFSSAWISSLCALCPECRNAVMR